MQEIAPLIIRTFSFKKSHWQKQYNKKHFGVTRPVGYNNNGLCRRKTLHRLNCGQLFPQLARPQRDISQYELNCREIIRKCQPGAYLNVRSVKNTCGLLICKTKNGNEMPFLRRKRRPLLSSPFLSLIHI